MTELGSTVVSALTSYAEISGSNPARATYITHCRNRYLAPRGDEERKAARLQRYTSVCPDSEGKYGH